MTVSFTYFLFCVAITANVINEDFNKTKIGIIVQYKNAAFFMPIHTPD